MVLLNPDRLLSTSKTTLDLARAFYKSVETLPIVSPHGHCEPKWFAENSRFPDPAQLFIIPDHYVLRMLVAKGVSLSDLGVQSSTETNFEKDPLKIWNIFAENYYLFRGTPILARLFFWKVFEIENRSLPKLVDFILKLLKINCKA